MEMSIPVFVFLFYVRIIRIIGSPLPFPLFSLGYILSDFLVAFRFASQHVLHVLSPSSSSTSFDAQHDLHILFSILLYCSV